MTEENRNHISLEDLERQYTELRQLSLTLTTQISNISNTLPLLVLLFFDNASMTICNLFVFFDNDIKAWISKRIYILISVITLYVLFAILVYTKCYKPFMIQLNSDPIKGYTMLYKVLRVSIILHPLFYFHTSLITIHTNSMYISIYLLYFSIFYLCLFIYCVIVPAKKRISINDTNSNCIKCLVIIPIILAFALTIVFMGEMSELNYAFQSTTERGTVIAIVFINSMILFYLYVGFEAENSSLVICISNELLIYLSPIIYTLFIIYTMYSFIHDCCPSSSTDNIIDLEDDFYYDDLDAALLREENEENQ